MRRFVRSLGPFSKPQSSLRFAVVVLPWLGTSVPWFSIALGAALAAKGAAVTFVVDSSEFGDQSVRFRFILRCIRRVLSTLPEALDVLELNAQGAQLIEHDEDPELSRLAKLNLVWARRGEMRGGDGTKYLERTGRQLLKTMQRVTTFLDEHSFDCILIPGGVHGNSGIWTAAARRHGIRCASFDSGGRGLLTVATDGVACQLSDIPRAFGLLKRELESTKEGAFVNDAAAGELQRRMQGIDRFSSQLAETAAVDPALEGSVLIALNSSWDSAALGLHRVFEDGVQWIVETTRFILDNSDARIIVRQHPAERFPGGRSTDDYRRLLRETFGHHPRIRFIAAEDPVNSYELVEKARIVIVHTSTIGVEAALRGKIVVTGSASYYSDLGFVWRARDLQEYRIQIADGLSGRLTVSDAMRADATACYYLTQCCNWISAPLSPEGYDDWISMRFEDIVASSGVALVCSALRDNVPVSLLAHRERLRQAAGSR
jgi:hypothetical protein